MDTKLLKTKACEAGADLIGVASADKWKGWDGVANPRNIQPLCQSVVVVGCRVLRGAMRGIEEGTSFENTYGQFGMNWNENTFLIRAIYEVANILENSGAEAVPLMGGGSGLDTKALAEAAGLGVIGKGGFFLTPEYGHRQRFGLVLTDLKLQGDESIQLDFCEDCDACLTACPLSALSDKSGSRFELNTQLCGACQNGRFYGSNESYEKLDRLVAACGRACMVAVENKIKNKFTDKFRKRAVWSRDLSGRVSVNALAAEGSNK